MKTNHPGTPVLEREAPAPDLAGASAAEGLRGGNRDTAVSDTGRPASETPRSARPVRRSLQRLAGDAPAARQAGILFVLVGLLGVVNDITPGSLGYGQTWTLIVDLTNLGIGIVCLLLPWSRWDPRWTLTLACLAFANIAWSNAVTVSEGPAYGIYFIIVFVWIGSSHRQWTSLMLAPVAVVAYVAPLLAGTSTVGPTTAAIVIPVGLLVGETIAYNVTRARRGAEQLHHQALHDALTGLPNRALILDRATGVLARARRNDLPVAAMFIDLDDFKSINDTLGHSAGDELLQSVASRFSGAVRASDTVGRLGGDEFVILVEGDSLFAGPQVVAERVLDVLSAPFVLNGEARRIAASIGIASGPRPTAEDWLRDADIALYEAKAAGKNGYVVFESEMQRVVETRVALEHDLYNALDDGEFRLLYQPIFDLRTHETTGVEALIRWMHPTQGLVMPGDFLPAAERTGLIVPIGRWVLNEACRQGAEWNRRGPRLTMSVNVSARQLERDDLVDDVRHALDESGLDPGALVLEITETTLMRDAAATQVRLEALKGLGVRLAIDDFGTGYSSMAYLQRFPVDVIKIDRSFISGIADTGEAAVLIRTIVQMGQALGLETLAEGIEDDVHLAGLMEEHCESGQGFLFAKPLTPVALEAFLRMPPATVAPMAKWSAALNGPLRRA